MHLGLSKNIELSLTGELMSGQVAHEIGILNHLVPREEVMNKSLALAAAMSKLGSTAMRLTKRRFRKLTQPGFDSVLEEAKIAQKEAYASGEPQEAIRLFLEARKSRKD
jgi:enoyl-CoA hydratase/carnithine racemase